MQFVGLFYARDPRAMLTSRDAPYYIIGRHALSAPDCASDGGALACANGRLRNGAALRSALASGGVRPVDGSLSALILAAYRLWGEEYPARLGGPVSSVIIDQDAGRLVLSRDRMGEQAIFYAFRGGSMAFSDHPTRLLDAPIVSRAAGRDELCELFGLGPARTPGKTPFRDILQIPPGCALIATGQGHKVRRYFALEPRPHEDDEARTIKTVRFLCEQAVDDAIAARPASMLSGGLDSTVLTALMARRMDHPVDSFSVDYEENAQFYAANAFQPERDAPYVEQAAEHLKTRHRAVTLSPEALAASLEEAMALRGFPGMADIDAALMLFSRHIAHDHQAVVSGECGDEVFGGYPWFHRPQMIAAESFPWSGSIALRERILKPSVREKLRLANYVSARYHESVAALPKLALDTPEEARLRQLHGLCLEWFMPNLQERAARMCPIRVLTPFCDDRLAQYVYNVPWSMKNMGQTEKGLLREAMRDLLPESLLRRRKSPFPKICHPRYAQLVCGAVNEMLDDPSSPILSLVDGSELRRLAAGPLSPSETPWFGQLMAGAQMLAYLWTVNRWMARYRVEIDL
jgi:asparagine synthase (glutamine-hydrolysing)